MARITDVTPIEEAKAIEIICELIDRARKHITTERGWHVLEEHFYEALQGRKTLSAAVVLAWADAGHPAADRAVRRYGAEILDQHREGELLAQTRAQLVKILLRPFVPFPVGRHVVANLMRDIWLPTLIQRVADALGLPPTRSATSTKPSVAYFFSRAMKQKGIKLSERQINRIYWDRNKVAAELEASMPLVDVSTIKEII
jgi:hypothetical protein